MTTLVHFVNRRHRVFLVAVITLVLGLRIALAEDKQDPSQSPDDATAVPSETDAGIRHFREKTQPLLKSRCISCHGPDKVEGGLRLDSRDAILVGGDSGPSVVLGKPDQSLLLKAVNQSHEHLKMPPKEKLPSRDVAVLERWIRDGIPWPSSPKIETEPSTGSLEGIGDAWNDPRNPIAQIFGGERLDLWSLQPVTQPKGPDVAHESWLKHDLDRFVLARLEQDKIDPPPPADARTLVRRLYFDLTGLPPTPVQMSQFDSAVERTGLDQAVFNLTDELLASTRFGEHFARLWLDVVRYSDSNGFDWDEFRPQAWRFRDYVIRSFNADKPFDQFIREQLAGDELVSGPPQTAAEQDCLIATGYLRLGPHDNAASLFNEQSRSRAELLADLTETTGGAFLGLTLNCCRCHDHKYDPLSQADHFRLRAFFAAVTFADEVPLDLADQQAEINGHNEQLDTEIKRLSEEREAIGESEQSTRDRMQQQIDELANERRALTHGLLMTDQTNDIAAIQILFQGDHRAPRATVEPGFLSIFNPHSTTVAVPEHNRTTGRRLALAQWIASADNPWTARVFVNRVWQSLIGRPLVGTPNDFGLAGSRPDDAELLDWLASELVREQWSVKKLVRTIVTSATYRQASTFEVNHFGLRQPRRLSAEQVRDAVMSVSGLLTDKFEGPAIWPDLPVEVLNSNPAFLDDNELKVKGWYPSPKPEQYCRSVFLIQKRNTRVPLLEAFDLPDNSTPCAGRLVSTGAPQALMLFNGSLTADAAQAFAERVQAESPDESQQVPHAFELALQRRPDAAESAACSEFVSRQSLVELCRALLNLNEFLYLD